MGAKISGLRRCPQCDEAGYDLAMPERSGRWALAKSKCGHLEVQLEVVDEETVATGEAAAPGKFLRRGSSEPPVQLGPPVQNDRESHTSGL